MKKLPILLLFIFSCSILKAQESKKESSQSNADVSLIILGTIQDAGSPHISCEKECCMGLHKDPPADRLVVSLGVVDFTNDKTYLFEASPDFISQTRILKDFAAKSSDIPDGIFLTHAHIGHYTGLMYLGKESINAQGVNVYTMPKMNDFLENNGPWEQLVTTENIELTILHHKKELRLNNNLAVTPYKVPHRDEYSETVGYLIEGPSKKALFIPDVDKWKEWDMDIVDMIKQMDYVFIDATFYDGEEVNNRDISEIPHPFVIESMQLFKDLSSADKGKVHFIHFNHTNPLINAESKQAKKVLESGFNIAQFKDVFTL